jgi:hypothetical protein
VQVSSKEFIDSVFSSEGILNKILKDYEAFIMKPNKNKMHKVKSYKEL